jgi:hypothetical protein
MLKNVKHLWNNISDKKDTFFCRYCLRWRQLQSGVSRRKKKKQQKRESKGLTLSGELQALWRILRCLVPFREGSFVVDVPGITYATQPASWCNESRWALLLLVAPGWELEHGPGKDDSKHAQKWTCYRSPTHERNYNRIIKVSKVPEKPSSCLWRGR